MWVVNVVMPLSCPSHVYGRVSVCMYMCMYECMYVRVRMYVCMYVYVCMCKGKCSQ